MYHQKLLTLGLTLLLSQAASAQSKIYVNAAATGAHTGATWATAYNDLSAAITAASVGDSIFVAKGIYKPSLHVGAGTDPRDNAFLLKDNIKIYGGFAGTETKLADRNESIMLTTNATVLSGDLGAPDSTDNCYHVVMAIDLTSKTILNGVIITNGNANGAGNNTVLGKTISRAYGGAMFSNNSSMMMEKVNIDFNYALSGGGGMNNENGCSQFISNGRFYGNRINGTDPGNGGGGAMRNDASNVMVHNTTFSYNKAYHAQGGGAVRNVASAAIFTDLTFDNNYSEDGDGGGAVYNANGSNSFFTNTQFNFNTTDNQGGAMYNDNSSPTLTNVDFYKNTGNGATGAMENDGGSNAILSNVRFKENTTAGDGGAMQNWTSSPILTDVTFENNTAGGDGGAIYNYNTCSPTLNRVKIINNTAAGNGGGFYNRRSSNPIITNTLIAKNTAGNDGGGFYNVAHNTLIGTNPCSPIFTNVSIANNTAGNTGGGAFDDGWGASKLRNSIATGNYSSNIDDIDAPVSMVASALYNAMIGDEFYITGSTTPVAFTGDVFLDTLAGDFRLQMYSPAIDMGDSSFFAVGATPDISAAAAADVRNADRIMRVNIDLGAYEVCKDTTKPTVTISPSTTTAVASGTTVVFTATILGGGTVPLYSWQKNGTAVGVYTNTYTAIAGTDFASGDSISCHIQGSPLDACISTDTIKSSKTQMLINLSITTAATNAANIKLYPNPNTGDFTIEAPQGQNYSLYIHDLTGRSVYASSISAGKSSLSLAGKLPAGSYLLSLQNPDMPKQVLRFVIH